MKLLFCPHCEDVRKLKRNIKTFCKCRKSWGYYKEDGLNAVINSEAIPLGIANNSLLSAIDNRPEYGLGSTMTAFVIPKICTTVMVADAKPKRSKVRYKIC